MAPDPEPTAQRSELPMRLTRLRVKNFRSIADIDIPLSPLTVLVGPNGSGKSNVVDAIRFVRDVFARGLDQAVMDREGLGVIQRWGTEGEGITIGVTVELAKLDVADFRKKKKDDDDKPVLHIDYDFTVEELADKRVVGSERITIEDSKRLSIGQFFRKAGLFTIALGERKFEDEEFYTGHKVGQHSYGPKKLFQRFGTLMMLTDERQADKVSDLGKASKKEAEVTRSRLIMERIGLQLEAKLSKPLFYTLNPADLRRPQRLLKETPFEEEGRNLAAVLRSLSHSDGPGWEGLRFALRQAVVGFDTLEVEAVGGYLATKLLYRTADNPPRTSYLGQESDGTIRMLGLLTALYQEPAQPFISIEEPEANIHPGALAVLASVLDEASLRSQVLVTTHSPDMLDHLPVESFLVVEKVGDTTHVGPLDASQVASVRQRLFTPGELLRMEGLQRQEESDTAS